MGNDDRGFLFLDKVKGNTSSRRLMLASPGEAVEIRGNDSGKWTIMAEVFFFEQKRVKTVDMGKDTQLT